MTVSILIPTGGAPCEHRDRAKHWIIARYRRLHPTWQILTGETGEPWSKGDAVHDAYTRSAGDVLVIADADSWVESRVLEACVEQVAQSSRWAIPHWMVNRLSPESTERVYAGWEPLKVTWQQLDRPAYRGVRGGGIVVVHRNAYETVGGIDPRFVGWGGEDLAFGEALNALVGLPHQANAHLWHLWHPHPAPNLEGSPESTALRHVYRNARHSPERMREVLAEWTRPDSSTRPAPSPASR